MQRSAGVITQAILVSCMLCSIVPFVPPAPSGRSPRQQTAIFRLSIVSLIQMGSAGGSQSQRRVAAVQCPRVWKVPAPLPWSHRGFLCGKWPASSLSHTGISSRACNQAKECCLLSSQRALSGACCFFLTQGPGSSNRIFCLGCDRRAVMGWLLEMTDGSSTHVVLMTPRLQNSLTVTAAGMRLFLLLPLSCTLIGSWIQGSFFSCFHC